MNYYDEIKEKLLKSEIYDRAKDYAKDRNKVKIYYETGELLSKAGREYGKGIIKSYSNKLVVEVGKKYNERTFRRIRLSTFTIPLHFREVLPLKDFNEIRYYLDECQNNSLTIKQLQNKIKKHEYQRLDDNTKSKLIESKELNVSDLVPNPIILKNTLLKENFSEYALKQIILNNLDDFLLQLGNGFTYVGNEYKIKIGNTVNYIDLLLYNIKYHCYIVIELKITELEKEHIGQIEVYMNYINKNIKISIDNDTVGIIICKKNNKYVIEYCSDDRIIAREYELLGGCHELL